jgi:hypothetical protein
MHGLISEAPIYQEPSEKVTVPENVPDDLVPIMLPSDFNQTINDQFCFILQNNDGNYSLNVNALNDYEMSNIIQGNESNAAFMNASENIKENAWYSVKESLSSKAITTNLYNPNGTLIDSTITPYDAANVNETVMLIANNIDRAVIFKDLTVKTLSKTTQPLKSSEKTTKESGLLLLYVALSILLVAAFAAALVYVKKKRQMKEKNSQNKVLMQF